MAATNPLDDIGAFPLEMVVKPGALPELFVPGAWDDDQILRPARSGGRVQADLDLAPEERMGHVNGLLIWLDDDGNPSGIHDAFSLIAMTRALHEAAGIGADHVDTLIG